MCTDTITCQDVATIHFIYNNVTKVIDGCTMLPWQWIRVQARDFHAFLTVSDIYSYTLNWHSQLTPATILCHRVLSEWLQCSQEVKYVM